MPVSSLKIPDFEAGFAGDGFGPGDAAVGACGGADPLEGLGFAAAGGPGFAAAGVPSTT